MTIYLSVLDFGVGLRSFASARRRVARGARDLNEIASTGLAMYAGIGLITLPIGIVLACRPAA